MDIYIPKREFLIKEQHYDEDDYFVMEIYHFYAGLSNILMAVVVNEKKIIIEGKHFEDFYESFIKALLCLTTEEFYNPSKVIFYVKEKTKFKQIW